MGQQQALMISILQSALVTPFERYKRYLMNHMRVSTLADLSEHDMKTIQTIATDLFNNLIRINRQGDQLEFLMITFMRNAIAHGQYFFDSKSKKFTFSNYPTRYLSENWSQSYSFDELKVVVSRLIQLPDVWCIFREVDSIYE